MVQRKVPVKVNELRGILNGLFLLLAVCDVRELLGNVISQTSDNLTATETEKRNNIFCCVHIRVVMCTSDLIYLV